VINKSIKFFIIFFISFNVFAGGDDRDDAYYANLDEELAAFEAQIAADLDADALMAEIEAEMARQAALDAFQAKLAADKAAAAASTAAYQDSLLDSEFSALEAQIKAEADAAEMMAEIRNEMARLDALTIFQQRLADEKAAAAASTAAYQAKLAYDRRVTKIMDDLIVQLDELGIIDDYKSIIKDELINEATEKLEDEKFIGTISGEIVTVAIHDFCKVNLGLSDSNIELFKKALEGGYLGNVGPQVTNGTEFSSNRWDDYINCVGSKRI
jgi:colicin import membrane protein